MVGFENGMREIEISHYVKGGENRMRRYRTHNSDEIESSERTSYEIYERMLGKEVIKQELMIGVYKMSWEK